MQLELRNPRLGTKLAPRALVMKSEARTEQEADRVRQATDSEVNEQIDLESEWSIRSVAAGGPAAIQSRLEELDREWDIERYLAANASTLAFTGVMLAAFHRRYWLILPAVVSAFLFQHAVQGWCPPLSVFRRLGIRTRKEIDREKYALKVLRGDFRDLAPGGDDGVPARRAMDAVTT
ncbi:MAG TPA: hypothetical protein VF701_06405 [Thermoanaerobaculia bacterium]